jgi:hypothetical protein
MQLRLFAAVLKIVHCASEFRGYDEPVGAR